MQQQPRADEAPAISRRYLLNWWELRSGKLIQICKLWHCPESGRMMAQVRYIRNEDGDLSPGAFDMTLSNITRYGRRVSK
jgi:hypothetical protein